jgi:hypothetical protein
MGLRPGLRPTQGDKNAFCPATALHRSAALPFVIPSVPGFPTTRHQRWPRVRLSVKLPFVCDHQEPIQEPMCSTIFPTMCPCSTLWCAWTTSLSGKTWVLSGIVREPIAAFNWSSALRDISPSNARPG